MNAKEQAKAAKVFADAWAGHGDEKSETQKFWLSLLHDVYGVENPVDFIDFEGRVKIGHTVAEGKKATKRFIDAVIPKTGVMIEQKSITKDLGEPTVQSGGDALTPYEQAKRYADSLPNSKKPRWIVTCNFAEFRVHDMDTEEPEASPQIILLKNLPKEYDRLRFLVEEAAAPKPPEEKISLDAGKIVGRLYDALKKQYKDPESARAKESLNKLCVRLVFCLYAEDAGIFDRRNMFHDYLATFQPQNVRLALIELFKTLSTPTEERDPYMNDNLAAFPYVNGGLFEDENIEIPNFTDEILDVLLNHASDDFDWSQISPPIFGALFESTLSGDVRRAGGMHYTSRENIHKVIDPLFLDELKAEFDKIKAGKQPKTKRQKLLEFQEFLASMTFLDRAGDCGGAVQEVPGTDEGMTALRENACISHRKRVNYP
ncbi:MAG: class I SAM-dependent DNA methyltransferase [Schwartzia sp.]|nr:class I SAM-dependent DNA methyltransferase [Schwartzia sp. (in: firmicutes)]